MKITLVAAAAALAVGLVVGTIVAALGNYLNPDGERRRAEHARMVRQSGLDDMSSGRSDRGYR